MDFGDNGDITQCNLEYLNGGMAALRRTSAARLANLLLRRNKIAKARHRDQPFHRLRRRPGRADEIRVEIAAAAFVRRVRDGLDRRPWLAEPIGRAHV